MENKKIFLIAGVVILIGCFGILTYLDNRLSKLRLFRQNRAEEIGEVFGIEPDWDQIEEYVDCTILDYGNSRNDVLNQLSIIGEYDIVESNKEEFLVITVYFRDYASVTHIGYLTISFEGDELVSKGRSTRLGDPKELICP